MQMIVEQQMLSTLPAKEIPVFNGDPLDFTPFLTSFEHGIETRTRNSLDCLYYLDQFTSGEANELVRSCMHMQPDSGYITAMKLLKRKFGDRYQVTRAYMDRALSWPTVKAEDSDALSKFSLFLTGCLHSMRGLDYLCELDHPTNLKIMVSKLPYKLRERWRYSAYSVQEKHDRVPCFSDLVTFVDEQSRILFNPLLGQIQDDKREPGRQPHVKNSTFSIAVDLPERLEAFEKPCLFCHGEHSMEMCRRLRNKPATEKVNFLKPKGLCFGCLRHGHLSRDCQSRITCKVCNEVHATVFHKNSDNDHNDDINSCVNTRSFSCATGAGNDRSVVSIVPVRVRIFGSNHYIETYAFLDNGSSAKLKATGRSTKMMILRTMGQEKEIKSQVISGLEMSDIDGKNCISLPDVFTQSNLPVTQCDIVTKKDLNRWPHMKTVDIKTINSDIGLLIGNNCPRALEPWKVVRSQGNGPYALQTLLGWAINGPLDPTPGVTSSHVSVNWISVSTTLEEQIKCYFNSDFSERITDDQPQKSKEDLKFLQIMNSSVQHKERHYSLALPFRHPSVVMPDNKPLAVQRAIQLKRRFVKSEKFFNDYNEFVESLLSNKYAEKVPEENLSRQDGKVWYIPHHGVYHPHKPDKIRVVFDCAASYRGTSLNKQLLQGPDMTNNLIGVLTRFRQYPIAVMADIEAMFYQVHVLPENYDMLRFLWWPNGDLDKELEEYHMKVHIFGAVSSPSCSNYALRKTGSVFSPNSEIASTIERNFYVDDCLKSLPNIRGACEFVDQLIDTCAQGGFRLTKWVSNCRPVIESIPHDERAKGIKSLDLTHDSLPIERALGMNWSAESDPFGFKIEIKEKPPTRRGILSVISSVFDPLGFVSPFTLPAKSILQNLCRLKTGWDASIPDVCVRQWNNFLVDLPKLECLTVDRCLQSKLFDKIATSEIHHFSDASETGYGTVSYLRQIDDTGKIHCSFLIGKSRVTPIKQVTIPRLGLTAATVAVRIDSMLKKELEIPISRTVFWTDSTSVLSYIKNESTRFHTFVAKRLQVIRDGSDQSQWRYVKSELNPADDASRGLTIAQFHKDKRWISGPIFLSKPEHQWPTCSVKIALPVQGDPEVKCVSATSVVKTDSILEYFNYFSSWYRLRRSVAWILRLKAYLRNKCLKVSGPVTGSDTL